MTSNWPKEEDETHNPFFRFYQFDWNQIFLLGPIGFVVLYHPRQFIGFYNKLSLFILLLYRGGAVYRTCFDARISSIDHKMVPNKAISIANVAECI